MELISKPSFSTKVFSVIPEKTFRKSNFADNLLRKELPLKKKVNHLLLYTLLLVVSLRLINIEIINIIDSTKEGVKIVESNARMKHKR